MATPYCFEAEAPSDVVVSHVFSKEDPPPERDSIRHGVKLPRQIPNVDMEVAPRVISFFCDESQRTNPGGPTVYNNPDATTEIVYRWDIRLGTRVGRLRPGTTVYWQQARFQGQPGGGTTLRWGLKGFGNPGNQPFDLVSQWNNFGGNIWSPGNPVSQCSIPLACTVTNLDFFINGSLTLHRQTPTTAGFTGLSGIGVHLIFVEPKAQFSRNSFCF